MLRTCAVLLTVLMCGVAAEAEKIENPEYQQWAKFKPGASATVEMVSKMGDNESEVRTTTTLKSIDDDKAVISVLQVMKVGDQEIKQTTERTLPAKIDKPEEPAEEDKPDVKKGKETIKVKAGSFKCETVETHMQKDDQKTVTKVWTCPQVPGGMVKMTMRSSGKMSMTTESELVEVKTDDKDED